MKTQLVKVLLLFLTFIFVVFSANSQEEESFFTISGVIKDVNTKKKIELAYISAVGTNVGTVTNHDGFFSLKISNSLPVAEIALSSLGYYNNRISIKKEDLLNQTFFLTPQTLKLAEIEIVGWSKPLDLLLAAIEKKPLNYSETPNLLTGFYRETIAKRKKYINISEAVIEIYKTNYEKDAYLDRVRILKGRKLVSPKLNDTLAVKIMGGPTLSVFLDVVKNPELLLEPEDLHFYTYSWGDIIALDNRLQYVVHFKPQFVLETHPLFQGTIFIDRETLAFSRLEFQMPMKDKKKVTDVILRSKPRGLRFTPDEVSYVVSYKQDDGKYYLSYLRNEMRFKCDWKRKLFGTNYTAVSEMVVTDINKEPVSGISSKEAFSHRKLLSNEIMIYYDKDFWGAYNIIEPTESLESAIPKLKKLDDSVD